jgi:hypothetical protein
LINAACTLAVINKQPLNKYNIFFNSVLLSRRLVSNAKV